MSPVSVRRFLSDVCVASEKAALIARACRREQALFERLIQEKTGADKNDRFAHDFKTLADVLIQETVRHDLGSEYPAIRDNILVGMTECVIVPRSGSQSEFSTNYALSSLTQSLARTRKILFSPMRGPFLTQVVLHCHSSIKGHTY